MFSKLQRINDSLTISAEPANFSVGDFITVGFVLSLKCTASNKADLILLYIKIHEYISVK